MSMLARVLVFVAILMVAARFSSSQAPAPVPSAVAKATATLNGTVADSTGALVSHATVTATDSDTGTFIDTGVSTSGKFSFHLVPGNYKLTVKADGFSEMTRYVVVDPDASETLNLILGGPVPVVQPHPSLTSAPGTDAHPAPHTPPKDVTVQSCTATTRADVVDCITTAADGHRLLGVIGGEAGTAYFIWLRDPAAHFGDIHISDPLPLASPSAVRDAYTKDIAIFCGSLKLTTGYLLFYR